MKVGEALTSSKAKLRKVKVKDYSSKGKLPVVDQGRDFVSGYTNDIGNEYTGPIPTIVFGDHTRVLKFVKFKFAVGADGTQILEPNPAIFDKRYFYYAVKNIDLSSYGYERHFKYLKEKRIQVPPLPTQKRIAAILSAFDDKIELNNKINDTLEQMAQAIFKEWFVKFRFPGHEKVKFVDSEMGKIPEGWEVKKCSNVVTRLANDVTYKGEELSRKLDIPVYDQSSAAISGYHTGEPSFNADSEKPVGLFGDHTCRMKLLLRDFSTGPNVVPFVGRNFPTIFVYCLTKGTIVQQEYKRHWGEFKEKKYALPPVELAQLFVDLVKSLLVMVENSENENTKLACLRDLLLPKLMKEEIRI